MISVATVNFTKNVKHHRTTGAYSKQFGLSGRIKKVNVF